VRAFERENGATYVGDEAWEHLDQAAGDTMSVLLEKHVRHPITEVLASTPTALPDITFKMSDTTFILEVGEESVEYGRENPS